jgi:DNA (cytosine-5)-methyltransferase 1
VRCLSLFSGCGGLDLGFRSAGFDVVLGVDSDAHCAQSHTLNFPDAAFYGESITDFVIRLNSEDVDLGDVDVLIGGPPCPPYSKSRFYRTEKPRGIDDQVGDETLRGYLHVLARIKPRAFVLENVAGFAFGVHRAALDLLVDETERLGYTLSWRILNAADYGVPQIRERFVMVGCLESGFAFPDPTHARAPCNNLLTSRLQPWRTAGDAISDLDTDENADDAGHFAGGRHHDLLQQIPPGDNYLFLTARRGHPEPQFEWRSRYWSFLLKLSPDLPSWTIQARRSNNMGPFHWRNRILRIDEIKRLQTFPDDWAVTGTVGQMWRQIGNAVPPRLGEAIGASLLTHLSATARRRRHVVRA